MKTPTKKELDSIYNDAVKILSKQPEYKIKFTSYPEKIIDNTEKTIDVARRHNIDIAARYNENLKQTKKEFNSLNIRLIKAYSQPITKNEFSQLYKEFAEFNHALNFVGGLPMDKGAMINNEISERIITAYEELKTYIKDVQPKIEYILKNDLPVLEKNLNFTLKINTERIPHPVKALFCYSVNKAGIMPQGDKETNGTYCKRVCSEYGLTYADRVRQGYRVSNTSANREKLRTLILPLIKECATIEKIEQALKK